MTDFSQAVLCSSAGNEANHGLLRRKDMPEPIENGVDLSVGVAMAKRQAYRAMGLFG